jgi:hypothetical protein
MGSLLWQWLVVVYCEGDHPPRQEFQQCDACQKLANDQAALRIVVKAAESQPVLLKFVVEVSLLKH